MRRRGRPAETGAMNRFPAPPVGFPATAATAAAVAFADRVAGRR